MSTWQEQIAEAHAEVIADIKSKFKDINSGPSVVEGVKAFSAAVDWTERWIIALLVIQASLLISVIVFRKRITFQACVFFIAMCLVYCAERINTAAAQHWERFASQDYFQDQGLFTSALLSAPLLLAMFVILINYMVEMVLLMVTMKRTELMYKARRRQSAAGAGVASELKKTK